MTVTEKVQEILEAAVGVTALCPTSRIRVPGAWQNLTRPFIVHFQVSADPQYTHQGLAAGRGWGYQVSVFAHTFASGEALAFAVVAALTGTHADSPATEGVTIMWEQGSWYVGSTSSKADGSGPPIEEFALEFQAFEGLV